MAYDTGSESLSIFDDELAEFFGFIPALASISMITAAGPTAARELTLEIRVLAVNRTRSLRDWHSHNAIVKARYQGATRLSSKSLNGNAFYICERPDMRLCVATNRTNLARELRRP